MFGPDGAELALDIKSKTTCSFELSKQIYEGTLTPEGTLEWSDGAVWVRKRDDGPSMQQQVAEEARQRAIAETKRRAAEMAQKQARKAAMEHDEEKPRGLVTGLDRPGQLPLGAAEDAKARSEAGMERARKAFEEEKARKAAALERARAAKLAAQTSGPEFVEAKAKSEAGMDRAKLAFEAEKARKAAALERARAKAAEQVPVAGNQQDEAKAKSEAGIDRARKALEEEKMRKAAALERARARAAEQQSAGRETEEMKSTHEMGMDRARKAFEEEKARKAAALERARAKAAAQLSGKDFEDAKAKSEAGVDRTKQAFEAEKARKAAALERARMKAVETQQAARASAPQSSTGREFDTAKAKSQDGMDRARQAFEAEKARKAAALERARAKLSGKGDANPTFTSPKGVGKGYGWQDRPKFGSPMFGASTLGFGSNRKSLYSQNDDATGLCPGTIVRLHGLKSRPDLNGVPGMTIAFDNGKGRWQVRMEGREDMLLKEENLHALSEKEYDALQQEAQTGESPEQFGADDEYDIDPGKASGEAMRWADEHEGVIQRGPGPEGNEFDVALAAEPDGVYAAKKIVDFIKERGVCLCEANAPHDLLSQAFDEAEELWDAGEFKPPIKVYDQDSQLEAQIWKDVLYQDENKVIMIDGSEIQKGNKTRDKMEGLKLLSQNMLEFARGIGEILANDPAFSFTHVWNAMLSCYTGNRTYDLHIDNPNGGVENRLPDNGLRLTMCYYINPHWNPEDGYNGGGLDVYLTEPNRKPASASGARRANKLRVAPHADTLVLFLSERMAHQVIATKGDEKWFCLTMWCYDQTAMAKFPVKLSEIQRRGQFRDDDD